MMNPKKWFLFTSLLFVFSLVISACQPLVSLSSETNEPVPTHTPVAVQAFDPAKTASITLTPLPALTITPGITPDITNWVSPTPGPHRFLKSLLPDSLKDKVNWPEKMVWTEDPYDAEYWFSINSKSKADYVLAETVWTYVLVAPFFTVRDEISFLELKMLLNGAKMQASDLRDRKIMVADGEIESLKKLLNLSNPQNLKAVAAGSGPLKANAWGDDWAIVPFDALTPEWKVIAINGISPLEKDYKPEKYPLSMYVTIDNGYEAGGSGSIFKDVLPKPNRNPEKLTSLIMTGVTAMARDTAHVMEEEGVLFPGTEIRDFMRAADLTHISNEVSFFADCPYPDPDYEGFIFCSNPEYIKLLEDLGADVIELTGNHNNDVKALYKVDSVPFSLDLYRKYKMQWYAGGTNIKDAKAPLLIEHNGNRLAFIGCNSYGPKMAWAGEDTSGSAPCEDFAWLKDEVSRLKGEGYIPVVTFQFQEDYLQEATSLQLRDFRDVAGAKPAIINGSQSHVAKAMEFYQDSFIHYGLGNLFFDQPDFYITYDSFVQEHFFFEGRHISTRLHTITIEETGKPRPMTQEERQTFLTHIFSVSEPLRSSQ